MARAKSNITFVKLLLPPKPPQSERGAFPPHNNILYCAPCLSTSGDGSSSSYRVRAARLPREVNIWKDQPNIGSSECPPTAFLDSPPSGKRKRLAAASIVLVVLGRRASQATRILAGSEMVQTCRPSSTARRTQ